MMLLPLFFLSFIFLHSCANIITTAAQKEEEEQETIITDFERPESFYNLQGTRYILVSEYNEGSRSISTSIALLDTRNGTRVELSSVDPNNVNILPSIFANPSCTALPFELLGAHGLDARPMHATGGSPRLWEVAVVNHYMRDSIEFYALNPTARTVTSMGCVDLTTNGEQHNSVSFAPPPGDDGSINDLLAVTLFYETYYGIKGKIAFLSSFIRPGRHGGDGALLLVRPGGDFSILKDNLNGPNGVWFANEKQIFIAQTPNEQVRVVDPETGEFGSDVVSVKSSPDNLVRFSNNEFLVTRVDSFLPQIALCFLLGIDAVCSFDMSVLRHNIETLHTEVIYSRRSGADSKTLPSFIGQPTAAIIKNGFLYIGNFQTNNLLRVNLNL